MKLKKFRANAYVDITDYIEKKIDCIAPHNIQSEKLYMQAHMIRSLAQTRYILGRIGTKPNGMAEAFAIRRMVISNR